MSWFKFFNPFEVPWWHKDEWVKVIDHQNCYEVAEKNDCPSWDLNFYFLNKYKNKNTCEERWRIQSTSDMFDKTIFIPPEEYVKKAGRGDGHYILMRDVDIYEGPKYE